MLPVLISMVTAGLHSDGGFPSPLCMTQEGTQAVAMDTKATQVVPTGHAVGSLLRSQNAPGQVGRAQQGVYSGRWRSDPFLGQPAKAAASTASDHQKTPACD